MIYLYKKFRKQCIKILEIMTCAAVIGLLIILLLQIGSRLLKLPLAGTMIWANMLLMWIAFPAACLGLEKKMQLGVDILYNILSEKYRRFMDVIAGASIVVFALFAMIYGGGVIAIYLLKKSDIIRFMFYLPLIISGCFMLLQGGERMAKGIFGKGSAGEEL